MATVFARGRKLYAKVKLDRWRQVATGYNVGEEEAARKYANQIEREYHDARSSAGPLTLRRYVEDWIARRSTKTVRDDETRLTKHVLPVLGDMLLVDVRPRHARDLVLDLRRASKLAPKTIREVAGLLHTVLKSAFIEELIPSNPIVFERGVLPKKVDKDPTWRHQAIYARSELEQLLFDPRIPFDRRVLYALKGVAALRHSEAARLTWAEYDAEAAPLGAINLGETKAGTPRRVPVHPALAGVLEAWRTTGWPAIYRRVPGAADMVVPTRRGNPRAAAESQVQLIEDLERIGLRVEAGAERNRRGHDLRRTFITLARSDGAIDSLLRWVTHGPRPSEMLDVYSSPPWEALCGEVAKVRISGAALVQSPQTATTTNESERPQRDSNPSEAARSDEGRQQLRGDAQGDVSPSGTAWWSAAPRLGAADEDLN